jgi:hypothetical protein
MEIEPNSYKLSYDEAYVVLGGSAMLENQNTNTRRVMRLVAGSI